MIAGATSCANSSSPEVDSGVQHRKTLLLGLGNDILSDDAVGLHVAAALRTRLQAFPDLTIEQSAEMGLALLDLVTGFDELVLVDAIQTGQAAVGFVHEIEGEDLKQVPACAPHFVGVGEMLALGRQLGLAVPSRVKIFAVEVLDPFTVGTRLTPALEAALPDVVERVAAALGSRSEPALQ